MGKPITLCFYQTRGEFMPLLMGQAYRLGLSTRPRKNGIWRVIPLSSTSSFFPCAFSHFITISIIAPTSSFIRVRNLELPIVYFHRSKGVWWTVTKLLQLSIVFLFFSSFFSVYCALLTLSHILWLKWPRREGRVPFLKIWSQRNFTVVACVVSEPTNIYATYPLANSLNSNSLFRGFLFFCFF